jgi:hypothetical protein
VDAMIEPKTKALMGDIDELLLAARHRPRNPESEAHKKFVLKNLTKLERIEQDFKLNFAGEKEKLRKFL